MSNNIWPIQPTFLSLRLNAHKGFPYKDNLGVNHIYSPNHDGVFSSDELRGYLADASDDNEINNPLSLFQIIPSEYVLDNKDNRIEEVCPKDAYIVEILNGNKIIRIDPGTLYSNFHCCNLFRKCNNGKNKALCFESDSRIALLYHTKLQSINFQTDFNKFVEVLEQILDDYNDYKRKIDPQNFYPLMMNVYDDNRIYIYYQCSYSKLYEYFFPITYNGKIVAVLMQGQRFTHNLNKEILFSEHIDNSRYGRKLRNSVNSIGKHRFNEDSMSQKRLNAITNRIKLLEERLDNEMLVAAQWYISEQFMIWENDFRIAIKGINSNSEESIDMYKSILSNTLNKIFYTFNNNGFIRIYSLVSSSEDRSGIKTFELIGDTDNLQGIQFHSVLKFSSLEIANDSIEKETLLKHLTNRPKDFDTKSDTFRLDVPFTSKKAYIIWKRYDNTNHNRHFVLFRNNLKSLYHALLEPYFILDSLKLEQKLEASMRISVHESVQVIPSVIDAINNDESREVLDTGKVYNGSPEIVLPMHVVIDASYRLLLLQGLFRRSTMIFKKDDPEKDWYDFHRIIYSTKSLFEKRVADYNYQKLKIISDDKSKISRYKLLTDYFYLSQILFNLLDNAVKYGLRGSCIYIKIGFNINKELKDFFQKECVTSITISVISYGEEITEDVRDNMYKLYYRHSSTICEGMGIGLFLVKKLCNNIGYSIKCKNSKQISDVNLPIYYLCRKQNDISKLTLNHETKSSLTKTKPSSLIDEVVNTSCVDVWEITEDEVEGLLNKPMFCNEFEVTIPTNDHNIKAI